MSHGGGRGGRGEEWSKKFQKSSKKVSRIIWMAPKLKYFWKIKPVQDRHSSLRTMSQHLFRLLPLSFLQSSSPLLRLPHFLPDFYPNCFPDCPDSRHVQLVAKCDECRPVPAEQEGTEGSEPLRGLSLHARSLISQSEIFIWIHK